MNTFLCLAITFLLAGLMFMYVRNQMTALEGKVSNLTEAVRTLAEPVKESRQEELPQNPPLLTRCYVSDDSESEDESEDEDCEAKARETPEQPNVEEVEKVEEVDDLTMVKLNDNEVQVRVIPMNMASMSNMMQMLNVPVEFTKMQESVTIDLDMSEIVDIGANVEVEEVGAVDEVPKMNYESMSVKELKELAAAKGAPASLKTKKALTEFLQA